MDGNFSFAFHMIYYIMTTTRGRSTIVTKLKFALWIVLFGSLWGINEVLSGEVLSHTNVPLGSVWPAAWAFFVLAIARRVVPRPGSSTLVGTVALLFRAVNASPFFCHLLGIFLLGLVFDIVASFLLKKKSMTFVRKSLAGILGAYGGYGLFAVLITYFIRYEVWVEAGLTKVLSHIFISGTLAALSASLLVPLGYDLGKRGEAFILAKSKWACTFVFLFLCLLWSVTQIIG
jgi:hypothetical protein